MSGPEQVHHNVEQVAKSNGIQTENREWVGKKSEKVKSSNEVQVDVSPKENLNRLTKEEAENQSEVDEKARETLENLEEIMTAFKKHKDDPEFNNLRGDYYTVIELIMRDYNNDVDDLVNNRDRGNKEWMENKDNTEFQVAETKENTWDSIESNYFNNKASAEEKAQEILNPQPEKVLEWIWNMNYVLKNGSPENKRILTETIKNAEEETAKLYNKIPRLEKNKN